MAQGTAKDDIAIRRTELLMLLCKKRDRPHPRDGCYAWLVCICSLLGLAVNFGTLNSFGVILPIWIEEFRSNRGDTAWIGSMASGFTFFSSPFAIKLNLKYGERIGGFCSAIAVGGLLIASSFTTKFVFLFITHGFLFGIFASVSLNGSIFIVKKWFKKNLGLALGISAAGGSLGIMSFNPMLQELTISYGWRYAFRILASIWVFTGFLCLFFTPNVEKDNDNGNRQERGCKNVCSSVFHCSLWKSPKYTTGIVVIWTVFSGYYVAMIHMISFAKDRGLSASRAALLFLFIGGCSTVFRVLIGKVNDKKWLAPMQSLQLSAFIIGASLVPLTQATEYYHFIIFAVFYGFGNGAFIISQSIFLMTCFGNLHKDAAGFGMGSIVKSAPIVTAAPIAGLMADHFGSYVPAFYLFGGLVLFSSILPFFLLFDKRETVINPNLNEVELGHVNTETIENGSYRDNTDKIGNADVLENADTIENTDTIDTQL